MSKKTRGISPNSRKQVWSKTYEPTSGEKKQPAVRNIEDIPKDERKQLQSLTANQDIQAIVYSDLLFSGRYGHSRLLLTGEQILVIEGGEIVQSVRLDEVTSAYCRDFVGNGLLEVHLNNGRRLEMIRYSKRMSDPFQEVASRVNKELHLSEDEMEAQEDKVAKISGPKEEKPTYRCPNCGHPLASASDACPKCTSKRRVLFRLLRLVSGHRRIAVWALLLSVLFAAIGLGPGYLVRELVDNSLRPVAEISQQERGPAKPGPASLQSSPEDLQNRKHSLYIIAGIFFCLIVARSGVAHFRIKLMGMLGERVVLDLRNRLYRTIQRLSLSYYDREHTGQIMSRVLTDTRAVQAFVVQATQQMIIDMLTVFGIGIVLFYINWGLAAIALLPIPFVAFCARHFSIKFRSIYRAARRKFATLSASVTEVISGMRVVKSFAQEDREISAFSTKNTELYNANMSGIRISSKFIPATSFVMSLGVVAVWLIGGRAVMSNKVSLGTLLLFITYMTQFYGPISRLMNLTSTFQDTAAAAERIFSVMDMPSDVGDHDKSVDVEDFKGRIDIENVSFDYNEGERILKNINLNIQPGEMIGLVGQTGSGKSTLISLICRFYDPTKGRILLDSIDLKDIKTQSLRSNIGIVLQEPFLFAGAIKDNIAYGYQSATEEEIIQAAKTANAHEFIMNLPDGYDSDVGERGVMLSGGEKQRIAIARAILKNPAFLIFDEATSAVDTVTEELIQEAIDHLVRGRTTIAIAHRLSTLRNADRLIVLENGEIIEQGTHEELIQHGGVYAKLCRTQAKFAPVVRAV